MATNTTWENDVIIVASLIAIVLAIVAGIRYLRNWGKNDQAKKDADDLLNHRVETLEQRLDRLEENIDDYRKENRTILEEIKKNQSDLKSDLSYIKGKMSKRDKTTSS